MQQILVRGVHLDVGQHAVLARALCSPVEALLGGAMLTAALDRRLASASLPARST